MKNHGGMEDSQGMDLHKVGHTTDLIDRQDSIQRECGYGFQVAYSGEMAPFTC
jgi:hypothetical protein